MDVDSTSLSSSDKHNKRGNDPDANTTSAAKRQCQSDAKRHEFDGDDDDDGDAAAEALYEALMRKPHCSAADAAVDIKTVGDALVLPPLECEQRCTSYARDVRASLIGYMNTSRAIAVRKRNAAERQQLQARHGKERVPDLALEQLPDEIMSQIYHCLGNKDRLALATTCYKLYKIQRANFMWWKLVVTLSAADLVPLAKHVRSARTALYLINARRLVICLQSDTLTDKTIPIINAAIKQVLNSCVGVSALHVLPYASAPGEWKIPVWLPPLRLNKWPNISLLDTALTPFWIEPLKHSDIIVVSNDNFLGCAKHVLEPCKALYNTSTGVGQYCYPNQPTTVVFTNYLCLDFDCADNIRRRPDSVKYMVIYGMPFILRTLIQLATSDGLRGLRSIRIMYGPGKVYDGMECLDSDYLISLVDNLNTHCPGTVLQLPLMPYVESPMVFIASDRTTDVLIDIMKYNNVHWYVSDEMYNRMMAITSVESSSYGAWCIRFAVILSSYRVPDTVGVDVGGRLQRTARHVPLKFLTHLRSVRHVHDDIDASKPLIDEKYFTKAMALATEYASQQ